MTRTTLFDAYGVLGVARTADAREIKSAYHGLVRLHHPDRNASSDESKRITQDLNAAYRLLSNPDLRREVDAFLDWQARDRARTASDDGERQRREREASQRAAEQAAREAAEHAAAETARREREQARMHETAERQRRERAERERVQREAAERAEQARLHELRTQRVRSSLAATALATTLVVAFANAAWLAGFLATSVATVRLTVAAVAVALGWLVVESRGFEVTTGAVGHHTRALRVIATLAVIAAVALGIIGFAMALIAAILSVLQEIVSLVLIVAAILLFLGLLSS